MSRGGDEPGGPVRGWWAGDGTDALWRGYICCFLALCGEWLDMDILEREQKKGEIGSDNKTRRTRVSNVARRQRCLQLHTHNGSAAANGSCLEASEPPPADTSDGSSLMPNTTASKRCASHPPTRPIVPPRTRFLHVYDRLPADAQQLLVQKHLAPLLDLVPKERRNRATASAVDMHRRYVCMPALNLKAKKAEIAALLLELSRDSKRALIKERSRREQLLSEAVDTLAKWLNDIWKVAFEFRANFTLAHACLLFVCDALDQIGNGCGGHVAPQSPVPPLTILQLQVRLRQHVHPHQHHKIHRKARQVLHPQRRPQSRERRLVGVA